LIVGPPQANRHAASVQIRDAIGNVKLPVDLILIATERFESTKDIIGGIAYPAHRYGGVLYEAA
jgi:hypothetical protein